MAVLDKFRIKVDANDNYSSNGTEKTLRQIHTHNGKLFPQHSLDNYLHPVIKTMGSSPNAYRQIYSTSTDRFVNAAEGIEFFGDNLSDAIKPMVTGKLKLKGIDQPVMHPYMVAVLYNFN